MLGKNKVAMVVAEFMGVATLAMAVYTIMARTSFPLFSGMAAGVVVALFTLAVGAVSGAHINPAITFGLWSIRKISTAKAIIYIAAQALGGLAAWALLKYFLGHSLTSIAGTGTAISWKVFVAEAIGTGIFAMGFAAAIVQKFEGAKLAGTIGLSLFVGVLVASLASNAVLNPAVAAGIQSWSKTYALAPLAGSLVGMNLYTMLFAGATVETSKAAVVVSSEIVKPKTTKKKSTTKKKK